MCRDANIKMGHAYQVQWAESSIRLQLYGGQSTVLSTRFSRYHFKTWQVFNPLLWSIHSTSESVCSHWYRSYLCSAQGQELPAKLGHLEHHTTNYGQLIRPSPLWISIQLAVLLHLTSIHSDSWCTILFSHILLHTVSLEIIVQDDGKV